MKVGISSLQPIFVDNKLVNETNLAKNPPVAPSLGNSKAIFIARLENYQCNNVLCFQRRKILAIPTRVKTKVLVCSVEKLQSMIVNASPHTFRHYANVSAAFFHQYYHPSVVIN